MSDQPQGHHWWVASDGKWYPPGLHPDYQPPPPPPPPVAGGYYEQPPAPVPPPKPWYQEGWLIAFLTVAAASLIGMVVFWGNAVNESGWPTTVELPSTSEPKPTTSPTLQASPTTAPPITTTPPVTTPPMTEAQLIAQQILETCRPWDVEQGPEYPVDGTVTRAAVAKTGVENAAGTEVQVVMLAVEEVGIILLTYGSTEGTPEDNVGFWGSTARP